MVAASKNDYSLSSFHQARLRRRTERRAAESSEERETRLAKRRVADRAVNSDGRTERRRERRAAEHSEQRETRLARRHVTVWRIELGLLPLVASE